MTTAWVSQPEMAKRIGITSVRLDTWRKRGRLDGLDIKVERRRVYYRAGDQSTIAKCLMSARTKWDVYVEEFEHFCGFGTKLWAVQAVANAYGASTDQVHKALQRAGIRVPEITSILERSAA